MADNIEIDTAVDEYYNNSGAKEFVDGAGEYAQGVGRAGYDFIQQYSPSSLPEDSTLGQSKTDFSQKYFPSDLVGNNSFNQHWIMFNINAKVDSAFNGTIAFNGVERSTGVSTLTNELSKVDALRSTIDQQYRVSERATNGRFEGGGRSLGPGSIFVPRRTRRIVQSIALFMPSTLAHSTRNSYADVSLVSLAQNLVKNAPAVGGFLNTGINVAKTAFALGQRPINPRIEVLFEKTDLREFQFDFLMSPSNEQESDNLREIIQTFRFHAAPEASNFNEGADVLGGILWVPPNEFDITFMHGTEENLQIPRINTCALEQIDIDYAPSGTYSTFSNGAPVKVRLQLRFKELEVNHKLRVLQGF